MLKRRSNPYTLFFSRSLAFITALGLAISVATPARADDNANFSGSSPAPAISNGGMQQSAMAPLPAGTNYHIHAGDQVSIQVYNESTLSETTTVLPDGGITFPLVGRIQVAGLSTEEAAHRIVGALGPYVRHPSVTVAVSQAAQYTVLVLGNVKAPGRYQVRSDARVSDAVAAAGGLGPTNGDYPNARISQNNIPTEMASLQRLFRHGDVSQNLPLSDGSVVYVMSPVSFNVEVVGAVDHPGEVEINEGDRLSMAIARAGNSTNSNADLNHVRVTRQSSTGKPIVYNVNLYEELEKGNRDVDIPLLKGDVVYVPQAKRGNAFGASGAVFLLQHLAGFPYF
jgi:polysaccharide export outer membrane protein